LLQSQFDESIEQSLYSFVNGGVITVISGTNRTGSVTLRVAQHVHEILARQGMASQILDLSLLPSDFFSPAMYMQRSANFMSLFQSHVVDASHLLFIIPEYNGSYPGVLKMFLDASPVQSFRNKHASMIGLSDGHAGNLRGQDHLTGVLHYLKMHVHYNKPKLSNISRSFDPSGKLVNEPHLDQIQGHIALITESM
jgi:NAD(P)H-dependent FMN reductase